MQSRTNTAYWDENKKRWRIAVMRDGVRKFFSSMIPGRSGQRAANAKADAWMNVISKKAIRAGEAFTEFLEDSKIRTGSEHYIKSNSICENYLLPALRKKTPQRYLSRIFRVLSIPLRSRVRTASRFLRNC